jgi:hypothetical protein
MCFFQHHGIGCVQLGLVMEDRSRLEHLMGIAQSLRIKGPKADTASSSTERVPFDKPARLLTSHQANVPDGSSNSAMALGGGILSALAFAKDSSEAAPLSQAVSSIPRFAPRDRMQASLPSSPLVVRRHVQAI